GVASIGRRLGAPAGLRGPAELLLAEFLLLRVQAQESHLRADLAWPHRGARRRGQQLVGGRVTEYGLDLVAVHSPGGYRDPVDQGATDGDAEMLRVDPGDLLAGGSVGQADLDRPEPARPQQGVVDDVNPVRRPDDEHRHLGTEAVHLGEELSDD